MSPSTARDGPEFLRSLYEHASTPIQEVTPEGQFLFVNSALCRMLGFRRADLLHRRLDEVIHPEDRSKKQMLLQALESQNQKQPVQMETRFLHRSGTLVWANVTSFSVKRDGAKHSILSFVHDTTESKLATEQFSMLLESAPNAMLLVGPSGNIILANSHAGDLFGYRREELLQRPVETLVPVSSRSEHRQFVKNYFGKPTERTMASTRELTARGKDGLEVPVQITLHPVEFSRQQYVLTSILDVTDRRKTEEALRASEDRLRLLLDSTAEGLFGVDIHGNVTFCNRSALRMLGYDCEQEAIGRSLHYLVHHSYPDGRPFPAQECPILQAALSGQDAHWDEETFWRADGTSFPTECWCSSQRRDGAVVGAAIAFVDITPRLKTAEALRKSEEKFSKAFQESPMALTITRAKDSRYVEVNDTYLRATGYAREEVIGRTPRDLNIWVNPEDRAQLVARVLQERHVQGFDVRYRTKNGEIRSGIGSTVLIEFGGERFLLSGIVDVTEQKRALESSRKSEERFRTTFRDAPSGMALMDPLGNILSANKAISEFLGYREEELAGMNVASITHPEDMAATLRTFSPGVEYDSEMIEKRFIRGTGEVRWALVRRSLIRDSERQPAYWISQIVDITERRLAETALRESEQRFRAVANSAPVMIWMSGPDRLCTFFNQPWLDFTGRSIDQELGSGWLESVHPDDQPECMRRYTDSFDRREPFMLEYRMRRHDGEYRWVVDRGVPRTNPDGSFAGYIGSCTDDTERRLGVEALRAVSGKLIQAQEQERKRIAGELHDDINQRLALLAVNIEQLRSSNLKPAALHQQLEKLQKEATNLSSDVQALSHSLHSAKLEYLGMIPAMSGFCDELARGHGLTIDFAHTGDFTSLKPEQLLGLYRMLQEALHNAVKHSGTKHFKVSVNCGSDTIRLNVIDNGRGFDPERVMQGNGIGIVSMMERARLMKGGMRIRSRPGEGTQVEIEIPFARG